MTRIRWHRRVLRVSPALRLFPALLLVVALALAACRARRGNASPSLAARADRPPLTLRVVGATDLAPAVEVLRAYLAEQTPPVTLSYLPTNTATGLDLLQQGRADVALASWLPAGPPHGYQARALGQDAVVVVVHRRNRVDALDLDTLRRLFEGRFLTWDELGGDETPIRLVSREDGSGTRAAFEALVMGAAEVALTAVVMPGGPAVVEYVARHPGAVGYASAALLTDEVKPLRVDGVPPTRANTRAGRYPLRRTVYLVFPADPNPAVRALLDALDAEEVEGELGGLYGPAAAR